MLLNQDRNLFQRGADLDRGIFLPDPFPSVPPSPHFILVYIKINSSAYNIRHFIVWPLPMPPAVYLTIHPISTLNCQPSQITMVPVTQYSSSIHPTTTALIVQL